MTISGFPGTALQQAQAIADKEISAEELVQSHFDRIDRINPAVNAIIWEDRDNALAEAKACDAEIAASARRGPLQGLPMTVKESYDIKGAPSTWGNPDWRDRIAETDSDAVARLRQAGAIVFGKTNVPLMLADWQSFNDVYGTTNNPWDTGRTPGGSSGGAAAALATGMTALEIGSDIGSSIRNPAHYCGVFGLKPTWNVVSAAGHAIPGALVDTDIAVCGPMARSAADLSVNFDVIAGPNAFERSAWAWAGSADSRKSLSDFRIGLKLNDPACPVDDAYQAVLQDFADRLARAGATVIEQEPDLDTEAHFTNYLRLLGAAQAMRATEAEIEALAADVAGADDPWIARIMGKRVAGIAMTHREWLNDDNERRHSRRKFDAFFEDFDVLLAPVCASAAFPHDQEGPRYRRKLRINGTDYPENIQLFWSGYSGVVGLPSVVGPAGSVGRLPVGYQAITGHGTDHTALAFAEAVEREIIGFTPPPDFAE